MKNCMKYITVLLLALAASIPAHAGNKFMTLKPAEHTLINGKHFMGLGGGKDPIRLAQERQDFFSLRRQLNPLPAPTYVEPKPIKEQRLESREALKQEPKQTQEELITAIKPASKTIDHIWPVDENVKSRISSPFGYRTHPVTGKYAFHAGLDIAAPTGTSVLASEQGEVSDIGQHQNLGNYVKVEHADGSYSLYGHLSKITAHPGRKVRQGQKIGEVGSTGRSTGPHLDYSLRKDGEPIDPAKHLKRSGTKNIALNN